jgi:hypothetical protein
MKLFALFRHMLLGFFGNLDLLHLFFLLLSIIISFPLYHSGV